jgi:uncharacterized protein YpbB
LFQAQIPDLNFIHKRIEAAYNYFFDILDPVLTSTYRKLLELQQLKKTKQLLDEIEPLSEELLKTTLNLKKVRLFFEAIILGKEVNKELYKTSEIENYKVAKIALIQNEFRQKSATKLIVDTHEIEFIETKKQKKTPSAEKKTTYEITLDLLHQGKTLEEIARERQLSTNTVNNHFVHLIKAEKIELEDVMEAERLAIIRDLLEGRVISSLTAIMEELDGLLSWDELKLYQASTLR